MNPHFVTVFDFTQKTFPWWNWASPLIFVAIGILFIAVVPKISDKKRAKPFGWIFVVLGSFFAVLTFSSDWSEYRDAVTAVNEHRSSVVEGPVQDFQPMPYEGHQDECFRVQGVQFCYSDYVSTAGFNQSASHGGPIRAGLPVRITYYNGAILKLEVPPDSLQPQALREASARQEEAQATKRLQNDPMIQQARLGFLFACVGITLWWAIDWRHFTKYYPAILSKTRIGGQIFRIFFLACFVGSTISLIEELRSKTHVAEDYKHAALYTLGIVVFFAIADLLQRLRWNRKSASSSQ